MLAPRGTLVDARPDSRVLAYVEQVRAQGHRRVGVIRTSSRELPNDRASDRAIATVARERSFRRRGTHRFWHMVPFEGLDAVRAYLANHLRFEKRARWTVDAAERRRIRGERFVIRRAVRWELLDKI
ncbi:MAG TPA: hypothetical protein VEU77_00605 [Candidatus Acidoferrales bacterium]|nr:hypothetical protein [Candidatus Acidoferrales bacterium]